MSCATLTFKQMQVVQNSLVTMISCLYDFILGRPSRITTALTISLLKLQIAHAAPSPTRLEIAHDTASILAFSAFLIQHHLISVIEVNQTE